MEWLFVGGVGCFGWAIVRFLLGSEVGMATTLLGGLCFCGIYWVNRTFAQEGLIVKCFLGALSVCVIQLAGGLVFNNLLQWHVWDYSKRHFQLFGQVCIADFVLWFFACIPLSPVCSLLRKTLVAKGM